jgi:hypothetical protein
MAVYRVEIAGPVWVRATDDIDASEKVSSALEDGFMGLNDLIAIYCDDDVMIGEIEVEEEDDYA